MLINCVTCVVYVDECTVSELNQLRVCADDFETKATIGRGHFGEVTGPLCCSIRGVVNFLCILHAGGAYKREEHWRCVCNEDHEEGTYFAAT